VLHGTKVIAGDTIWRLSQQFNLSVKPVVLKCSEKGP
jgi:hypothetical protein